MPKATAADVVECYRFFLDREPESEEVVRLHLDGEPDLWQLVKEFETCAERAGSPPDSLLGMYRDLPDARRIEVAVSPELFAALLARVEAVWSDLGATEPYWSVVTYTKYLAKVIDPAGIDQFYQSGEEEAAFFSAVCARNGISIDPSARILDFGCGVARIGEHLAGAFRSYLGVDISAAHLQAAHRRLTARGLENVRLMLLRDFLAADVHFDVFYSILCLQHNPPPIMLYLLHRCLARLAPGGIAFFQLPCQLMNYEFDTDRYLAAASPAKMEMHALPQPHVFSAMAANEMVPIEAFPWPCIGPIGLSYAFLARKKA